MPPRSRPHDRQHRQYGYCVGGKPMQQVGINERVYPQRQQ